ncbi:hypothetical protein KAFR_0K00880 [Kazachstania africana CBS 2517]|uniref:Protein kinase domain-containing protein n=1 Tax=Kazachstania africana (strain ATCC 22294 / BCRC 22015 / CBS 2517 / CECT 1963 / NBRC 1671 / NRRL Y-8276) TaxID=1071382 RepID=H2B1E4_KAZAF|nr:hypothetical protein KAFR_0K00880 [Kazachstania africana CBS 2517]CCF60444.1 hypothetical protein KAFR_0K00880 [Kazachstania africana CBS 2517]
MLSTPLFLKRVNAHLEKFDNNNTKLDNSHPPTHKLSPPPVRAPPMEPSNNDIRLIFEKRLLTDLEDMDDPLELFLDYISWIHEANENFDFLIDIMERCLSYIKSFETYHNDPRFLKIWLLYMDFIKSENLNDYLTIFNFMYSNNIGSKLSLFYEEYSKLLWKANLNLESLYILNVGINQNSRPYNRLIKKFNDIETKLRELDLFQDNWQQLVNFNIFQSNDDPPFIKLKILNDSPVKKTSKLNVFNDNNNDNNNNNINSNTTTNNNNNNDNIPVYKIVNIENRKPEKIDCNFDLIYNSSEFNFDQILALSRNVYHKNNYKSKKRKLAPLQEKPKPPLLTSTQNDQQNGVITKTSILPLKDSSVENTIKSNKLLTSSPTQTVTFFSKDAMKEVYSMFNQDYKDPSISTNNDENTTNRFSIYENFTQEFTRPNIDDLTEVKQPVAKEVDNEIVKSPEPQYQNINQGFITPIKEISETTIEHKEQNFTSTQSSPFLTQPRQQIIEHPLDESLRASLLSTISPPLTKYDTFYSYDKSLKMSSYLKKIHRLSINENKNPIVDFKMTSDLYCIRGELGQGGYATVYLAESSTGDLKALKVEKPANVWEYYILKQIQNRLQGSNILNSVIDASSLHCFLDESYLVLNYANQGTVLDLINITKDKNDSVDEILCMFLTVEIMKIVETLHEIGIIHGDLKPENCMIRFESYKNLGKYNAQGANGWNKKGVYLIDFGRSFDLTLFEPGIKFKADWKTDQQDCYEMRMGKPWSYEADYYGLASIIHSMLFGKLIETIDSPNGKVKLKNNLKRYWQKDLWQTVFDTLLNSNNFSKLPITSTLKSVRNNIESFLVDKSSDNLRKLILDLEPELSRNKDILKDSKKKRTS